MSNLNLLVLNLGKLNLSRARLEELARSLNGSAYGGYVKDGLIFQLDCKKGIKTVSDCDDAARANLGGDWRTPTLAEAQKLMSYYGYVTHEIDTSTGWYAKLTGVSTGEAAYFSSIILTSTCSGDYVNILQDIGTSMCRPQATMRYLAGYVMPVLPRGGNANGHEVVDFGFDDIVFAKEPLAIKVAYGEVTSKDSYTIGNYKWYDSDAGEYTKYNSTDGLTTLQLSYNEHTNWTDLIQKAICEGTTTFETTAGVVFDGENYFVNPYSPEDEVVVEIAEKSDEELETTYAEELATNIGEGYTGTIYEIRVYLKSAYTDETKAKNALIDQNRFGDAPANALVDADGTYLLDKDGYYIISND